MVTEQALSRRHAGEHADGPHRVLLLTGSIGAGHDAAAAAVGEALAGRWPDAEVLTRDVLAGMGRGAPQAFSGVYAACVRTLPWLYGSYYALLVHAAFFRAGTRAVVGRWTARAIAPLLAEHRPDLVVATVPEGVQGLAHLRRAGRLPARAVVVLSDPAPQPLWCDADLDVHLVTTDEAARRVRRAAPGAEVRVVRWPVVSAFHPPHVSDVPGDGREHRSHGVLVAGGSLGFGDLPALARAVLAAGWDAVVAAPDPRVRARLDTLAAAHPGRLEVRRRIDDPAAVTRAVDAVVTTGGGASAFEALACTRPLLVADPIPGHGRDGARLLARAGLAELCPRPADLTAALRRLADPAVHAARVAALRDRPPGEDLASALTGPAGVTRVRPEDALFWHASTARVPQVLGARIVLATPADDTTDWPALVAGRVRERAGGIEVLARRLDDTGPLRWVPTVPDPARHVDPALREASDPDAATTAAVVGAPLDPRDVGWRLTVVRTGPREVSVLAAAHHVLGDGLAVTDALTRLLTDEGTGTPVATRTNGGTPADRVPIGRRLAGIAGIAALARRGVARRGALGDPTRGGAATTRLVTRVRDAAEVRAAARTHGTGTTVLVLAVVAEALAGPGTRPVRAMVPLTTRLTTGPGAGSRAAGNRTAAVAVDLPVGPQDVDARVAAVHAAVERARASGQADGAAAVLAALGWAPGAVSRAFARLTYRARFFHLIVSVMPGLGRPVHVGGALVREVVPVLPLAEGVGLAVGAIRWNRTLGIGITLDDEVLGDEGLPARVDEAWDAVVRGARPARARQDGHRR
ncbi:WS/DGAT domain-containing protein [Actinomycetospora cinnamomea]|uniref:UDP-N-acetylglucosamine:LPS N-acetylglucosamine transferase n=1 Tax=Actinomycetospora cinnamomea TaxID=663609 RepID=A0A2U1F8S5_9PSEU|nr:WS/DGAT domain-containing protein [Actinomycetospora cinnamomea]PVZ08593.1 UDP-N-acetylglucosamine:LPS N-acetylglucosamine transferase [Actinomycetospora cinnamomea]